MTAIRYEAIPLALIVLGIVLYAIDKIIAGRLQEHRTLAMSIELQKEDQ